MSTTTFARELVCVLLRRRQRGGVVHREDDDLTADRGLVGSGCRATELVVSALASTWSLSTISPPTES
jgi:hypothetical protein